MNKNLKLYLSITQSQNVNRLFFGFLAIIQWMVLSTSAFSNDFVPFTDEHEICALVGQSLNAWKGAPESVCMFDSKYNENWDPIEWHSIDDDHAQMINQICKVGINTDDRFENLCQKVLTDEVELENVNFEFAFITLNGKEKKLLRARLNGCEALSKTKYGASSDARIIRPNYHILLDIPQLTVSDENYLQPAHGDHLVYKGSLYELVWGTFRETMNETGDVFRLPHRFSVGHAYNSKSQSFCSFKKYQ